MKIFHEPCKHDKENKFIDVFIEQDGIETVLYCSKTKQQFTLTTEYHQMRECCEGKLIDGWYCTCDCHIDETKKQSVTESGGSE